MFTLKSTAAAGAALMVAGVLSVSTHAFGNAKETSVLTFNTPIALPSVTLAAGTYIFERADETNPHVVQVLSRDRKQVYLLTHTRDVERPDGMRSDRPVVFGESPNGVAPIKAWFPAGQSLGHEFVYNTRGR